MDTPLSFIKRNRYFPVAFLFCTAIFISLCTRIALLISAGKMMDAPASAPIAAFFIGLLYDIVVAMVLISPFVLHIGFTNNFIYSRQGKWITVAFFGILLSIFLFTHLVPQDFNKDLYNAVIYYILLRFLIFLFLLFKSPAFRIKWRAGVLLIACFMVVFLLIFNAASEWFFWNEFSSRYNFIAVDYLVYTTEVIGNIRESYPITAILLMVGIITVMVIYFLRKFIFQSLRTPLRFSKRFGVALISITACLLLALFIPPHWQYFSRNNYVNELAGNGLYDFVQAFKKNELDFFTYYKNIPDTTAFRIVRQDMETANSHFVSDDPADFRRTISYPEPEKRMNIVLISVESLSASFMQSFGDTSHITPGLDSLAAEGMLFTNLYASGTRTVRGLEALSLSIPPLPGQSIVKRPDNSNLFSLGSVLRSKGYTTQYLYGGYGYFDNMNTFFGNNGYEVIDRTALQPKEIHYENIWGVADEDLFTLALRTMDKNYTSGRPFFTHVMTVSNHRPYTYPDGRIDIPSSTHSRNGAVKYTDYAITHFIKEAAGKPWFGNTVFVIVADHCASSAGKQALPLPGYHIPMIMYAPGHIQPQRVNSLMAQIDIAPTILGMLHFSYTSQFFGQDIFQLPAEKQRAFIGTYQGLGYLKNDTLIVQTPVKMIKTYKADPATGDVHDIAVPEKLVNQAVAYYQYAAWLISHKKYRSLENESHR